MSGLVVPLGLVAGEAPLRFDGPTVLIGRGEARLLLLAAAAGRDRHRWLAAATALRRTRGGFLPLQAVAAPPGALAEEIETRLAQLLPALRETDGQAEVAVTLSLARPDPGQAAGGRAYLAARAGLQAACAEAGRAVLAVARSCGLTVGRHRAVPLAGGRGVDVSLMLAERAGIATALGDALRQAGHAPLALVGPLPCLTLARPA